MRHVDFINALSESDSLVIFLYPLVAELGVVSAQSDVTSRDQPSAKRAVLNVTLGLLSTLHSLLGYHLGFKVCLRRVAAKETAHTDRRIPSRHLRQTQQPLPRKVWIEDSK